MATWPSLLLRRATTAPLPDAATPRRAPLAPPSQGATPGPLLWGLALGGGAMRGVAHLGVLEQLLPAWGMPQTIAGTSVGAVVGAALAVGHPVTDLQDWALRLRRPDLLVIRHRDLWRHRLQIDSLFAREALETLIGELIPATTRLGDLALDLQIVATHLETGHPVVFSPTATPDVLVRAAVRASASIPGVFPQIEIHGAPLIDGMIALPVPARLIPAHLTPVAVSLSGRPDLPPATPLQATAIATSMQALNLVAYRLTRAQLVDVPNLRLIEPPVHGIPPLSFQHTALLMAAGRDAAAQHLAQSPTP